MCVCVYLCMCAIIINVGRGKTGGVAVRGELGRNAKRRPAAQPDDRRNHRFEIV